MSDVPRQRISAFQEIKVSSVLALLRVMRDKTVCKLCRSDFWKVGGLLHTLRSDR